MSSPGESERKGGHLPAVKAGGMRITQRHTPSREPNPVAPDDENNAALKVSTSPPKTVTISGAPVRGNADFPVEAVQSYHDKPVPTHDRNVNSKPVIIQQPRK
uniref:Death-associated protein 1 n=1 Tax=Clastoptera arizonana TaxID=38151 RepID=A0A1B6E0M6_9HEMI